MNLLFITDNYPMPTHGGIERVVKQLAVEFTTRLGYTCYLLYINGSSNNNSAFEKEMRYCDNESLDAFIVDNKIDVVLNNTASRKKLIDIMPTVSSICKKYNVDYHYVFHMMPGFETVSIDKSIILRRLIRGINVVDNIILLLKQIILILLPTVVMNKYLKAKYSFPINYVDRIILLSSSYIRDYIKLSCDERKDAIKHYDNIANPLSFDCTTVDFKVKAKEKIVLVVARMDEKEKRISLTLRIWKEVESDERYKDWKLVIIGDGNDLLVYKSLSKDLKRCEFIGRQNPETYYEKSAIFMMTSASEGFGITLIEAQQNGVVPVAFDSYSAVHDIIEDGKNGVIVENNNINAYVGALKKLMIDKVCRENMAVTAIDSVQKFNVEITLKKWKNLIEKKK